MFKNIINKLKHFFFYTKVVCVRTDKYIPIKYKLVKKSYLNSIKIYKTTTCDRIYDEEHDRYYMINTCSWEYKRGAKILIQNTDTKEIRLATCKSHDKIGTFPDILDGHETPGIGYTYIGIVVEK